MDSSPGIEVPPANVNSKFSWVGAECKEEPECRAKAVMRLAAFTALQKKGPPTFQLATPGVQKKNPLTSEKFLPKNYDQRRRRSKASKPMPPTSIAAFGSGTADTVMVTKAVAALGLA